MTEQSPEGCVDEKQGRGCRVLVVDDRHDAADTLAMLIEICGHQPIVAYNAASALDLSLDRRPDVVLLDIGLPGMDGREVARQIRRQPGMADALLVAVTGYGGEQEERSCREAGFDLHLLKPFDSNPLRDLLAARAARLRGGAP